ncbi:hypothetical protein Dimus_032385 [Dionaea muscipula]
MGARDPINVRINWGVDTVVGLDIEWRPHYNRWMSNKTATLQLCIDTKCLIVQLFYVDQVPQSLKSFCSSPNYVFVGLEDEYGLPCLKTKDVKAEAKSRWPSRFRRPGLKDLAWEVAGLRMEKPKTVSMSNWENRVLTEKQIEYACIDAYASYKIGHKILIEKSNQLFDRLYYDYYI